MRVTATIALTDETRLLLERLARGRGLVAQLLSDAGRRWTSSRRQPTGTDSVHLYTDRNADYREDDTEQAC
jgi:hypothetical protein